MAQLIIAEAQQLGGPALVDLIAPEHVEFCTAAPEALSDRVRHAGAIFLGRYTPEAIAHARRHVARDHHHEEGVRPGG